MFAFALFALLLVGQLDLHDSLSNEGLIWGTWFDRNSPTETQPVPPCYNETTCIHVECCAPYYGLSPARYVIPLCWLYDEFVPEENEVMVAYFNVTGYDDAYFCNDTVKIQYAELVDPDDFLYVDRECQLRDSPTMQFQGVTLAPGPNTSVRAWGPKLPIFNYSTRMLKVPGNSSYYFQTAFPVYVGPVPGISLKNVTNYLFNLDTVTNNGIAPVTRQARTHAEIEQMIYDQLLVPKNYVDVIPCEHA